MVNAEVLDDSDLIHMLMLHKRKTVDDYTEKVFLPPMLEKFESEDCLDIIWNRYLPQGLKQATKHKRGSNCRV